MGSIKYNVFFKFRYIKPEIKLSEMQRIFLENEIISRFLNFNETTERPLMTPEVYRVEKNIFKIPFYFYNELYLVYIFDSKPRVVDEDLLSLIDRDLPKEDIAEILQMKSENSKILELEEGLFSGDGCSVVIVKVLEHLTYTGDDLSSTGSLIKIGPKLERFLNQEILVQYGIFQKNMMQLTEDLLYIGPDNWKINFSYKNEQFCLYGWDYIAKEEDNYQHLKQLILGYEMDQGSSASPQNIQIIPLINHPNRYIFKSNYIAVGQKYYPIYFDSFVLMKKV